MASSQSRTSPAQEAPKPGSAHRTAEQDDIAPAIRGMEIRGLDIFRSTQKEGDFSSTRAQELVSAMKEDVPTGGHDMIYGDKDSQRLRLWKPESSKPPVIVFVHGGSWRVGTYLDSTGSAKVTHLVGRGYAFATVNYSLVPSVTVEEQVQEVADAVGFLVKKAADLDLDPKRVVLMGHSSGAHVVTLLGTDTSYFDNAGVDISLIHGVIALDGSNYNAITEFLDSPGPVADNMKLALGEDPLRLRAMSPTYNARERNARAFLLLHVQRQGDIRQAVELAAVLQATGTAVALHVFEGQSFEGHMQMLLRLGADDYPATHVMDSWLEKYVTL